MPKSTESLQKLAERRDMQDILLDGIRMLPERQQKILLWGFFGELNDTEIAEKLGITRNYVYVLRHRALKEMRRNQTLRDRLRGFV